MVVVVVNSITEIVGDVSSRRHILLVAKTTSAFRDVILTLHLIDSDNVMLRP